MSISSTLLSLPLPAALKQRVANRHDEQRQERRGREASDDRYGEARGDQAVAAAGEPEGERQQGKDGGEGRHQDGPEPRLAGRKDSLVGGLVAVLRLDGEVDEQDGVRDHDPDKQQDAEQRGYGDRGIRQVERAEDPDRRQGHSEKEHEQDA